MELCSTAKDEILPHLHLSGNLQNHAFYTLPPTKLEYNSKYFQIYHALFSGCFQGIFIFSVKTKFLFYRNSSYNYCLFAGEKLCLNYPCFIIHTLL